MKSNSCLTINWTASDPIMEVIQVLTFFSFLGTAILPFVFVYLSLELEVSLVMKVMSQKIRFAERGLQSSIFVRKGSTRQKVWEPLL